MIMKRSERMRRNRAKLDETKAPGSAANAPGMAANSSKELAT